MTYSRSKIDEVKAIVARRGGWGSVFSSYPALNDAMDKCRGGISRAVPCPISNDGKTVFRLYKDWEQCGGGFHNTYGRIGDGIDMVAWLEDCSKSEAMDTILEILNESRDNISQREVKQVQAAKKEASTLSNEKHDKNLWVLQKIEKEMQSPAKSTIANTYRDSRGLIDMRWPKNVGFHPNLKTFDQDGNALYLPGLVFYVHKLDGTPVTFHRIFLSGNGKDKARQLENSKMQLSGVEDVRGAAIELDNPLLCIDPQGNERVLLAVGEGPETCMCIQYVEGVPVWSGISSTLMELMHIPNVVTDLLIFIDKDTLHSNQQIPEGLRAGLALKERIEKEMPHCTVWFFEPQSEIKQDKKSQDWLDEFVDHDGVTFPNFIQTQQLKIVSSLERC
ncbi:DUF7146 domain-containing protein (plasmid) [Vibrio scophthalmi]|uniref:DUF7146 domain-containing protein n=1 Tax=Vibrio scophthalmi TaxID=45658 RepID=UPI003EBED822